MVATSAFGTKRTTVTKRTYQWHISCTSFALTLPTNKPLTLQSVLVENTMRSKARHSIIVSLHVPETGVDLLAPVQLQVDALIASQIEITS